MKTLYITALLLLITTPLIAQNPIPENQPQEFHPVLVHANQFMKKYGTKSVFFTALLAGLTNSRLLLTSSLLLSSGYLGLKTLPEAVDSSFAGGTWIVIYDVAKMSAASISGALSGITIQVAAKLTFLGLASASTYAALTATDPINSMKKRLYMMD